MQAGELIGRLSALAGVEGRLQAARDLATGMGATDLVVLVGDPDTGALLPATGFPKTLPGGPAWNGFLERCRTPGVHRGQLPWASVPIAATGCCAQGVAVVLLGEGVADSDASLLTGALPLLAAALRTQQELAIARGELRAARYELNQSAALMKALDEARREVDRAMFDLDAQARTLEHAKHRAEAATRAKDQFLAMLGHELRNPLAPIVTSLELLSRRGRWSGEHDIIRRQVDHMTRLVDDLLDVARIAGGKLTLDRHVIELDAVLARAVESVQPLMGDRPRPLHVDAQAGLRVDADPARLAQVFSNLLTNALKYSNPGTPVIMTARSESGRAVVEVVDRGIGIEAEQIESVFELFEQQGRGIDRAQGGLGLGLAIVRNLVQLHGGSVRVHSAGAGQGSRFTVELPLAAGAPQPTAASIPARAQPRGRGKVLLVDDNFDALTTLAMALEMAGYEVRTAADGFEALQVAAGFGPDVAVLDIGLPGMSGYELAPRLQQASAFPLRLIAVTGYGQATDRQRTAAAGFHTHLVKPVDIVTLCDALGDGAGTLASTARGAP